VKSEPFTAIGLDRMRLREASGLPKRFLLFYHLCGEKSHPDRRS
jgi:hypothetical protein